MIESVVLSSLHQVFPQSCPAEERKLFSCLSNEPLSFQIAYRLTQGRNLPVFVRTQSQLKIRCYAVQYVGVKHTAPGNASLPSAPGLYPDMLVPKGVNKKLQPVHDGNGSRYFPEAGERLRLNAADCWQSLWFSLNEQGHSVKPGIYPVTVSICSGLSGEVIAQQTVTVRVLNAKLPAQKLIYTNWVHCDCLADYYQVEVYSDRFFEILENFLRIAAQEGMNAVLLPAFTPALDTPVGTCRRNVQLVKVKVENGTYQFDFSLMKRFIQVAKRVGIRYLEHAHFFSQWGATSAPAVYADVNGTQKQIFGWKTKAAGKQYAAFLRAYIPSLRAFLESERMDRRTIYHISDEPSEKMIVNYQKAAAIVEPLLKGCIVGDALSHYELYQAGAVKMPIVSTANVQDFAGKCDSYWCYYTGGQSQRGLSNRLITTPSPLNRILGAEMYHYGIKGFLHWGLNFYYDALSLGMFDPKVDPCGYKNFPGASYCLYPAQDGTAYNSIRYKVFYEGINDLRALELLEKKRGRPFCENLLERHFGPMSMYVEPESAEQMLRFRDEVNDYLDEPQE